MKTVVGKWKVNGISLEISKEEITYDAKDLNPFHGQKILFGKDVVGAIKIEDRTDHLYLDTIEINRKYRGKGLCKHILNGLFQDGVKIIKLSSVDDVSGFWFTLGAEDFGRTALVGDSSLFLNFRFKTSDFRESVCFRLKEHSDFSPIIAYIILCVKLLSDDFSASIIHLPNRGILSRPHTLP